MSDMASREVAIVSAAARAQGALTAMAEVDLTGLSGEGAERFRQVLKSERDKLTKALDAYIKAVCGDDDEITGTPI